MNTKYFITKQFVGLFFLLISTFAQATDLVFTPATPYVEVGQQITLSVSGTSGEIIWTPNKGSIQGSGTRVTYTAPFQAGTAGVMVMDSKGNIATVKIMVTPKQNISLENASWELFAYRNSINDMSLSKDGKTLWVGTMWGGRT